MSIATAISALQSASSDIASAIEAKGVTVPSGSGYDDYASLIGSIPTGGSEFDDWVKDGDTHLWINIVNEAQLNQQLRIRLIGTIDWGDGSTKTTANVTTSTTFTHTYTALGRYRIDLHKTDGTFLLGNASSGYCVMGARGNSVATRVAVLYQAEIGSGISALSAYAFYTCHGLLRIYIPKTVTEFRGYVFGTNYSLKEVIFEDPSTITVSGYTYNFNYCYLLQKLTPLNITGATEMSSTHRYNYNLTEITIPSSITSILNYTFQNNYCLKHLWCLPTSAPSVTGADTFTNLPSDCVIHVPYGSLSSYQSANSWSTYSSQMEEAGTVKYTLTNVTRDNLTPMVAAGDSFTSTLTPASNYTLGAVTVKMGDTDITSSAYSAGVVTIASVTGNIVITATGKASSGYDVGYYGANMLSDGTFEQMNKPYRYVVSTFKREVESNSAIAITVTNFFPSHKLLIKVFEYDTNQNFIQRIYDSSYSSRSTTFTYSFTTSATTKYIEIGFEAVESPSGVSGPSLEDAVSTYTSMSVTGTSDNLFEPDSFTLYGFDSGYYGANMASNGTLEKKTTKSYKYAVSTFKRLVTGGSPVSITVTNAYTNHTLMLKIFEYGETWNFIQRTYDADYASRGTTFTYTFTPTANTRYICIGFEAVAGSGVAAPTVDDAAGTYSSMSIIGSDMSQFDPSGFTMYT